jgi:hypothetical protein
MPIKKEIIYPIFLECIQYIKDSFWKTIFEDLAYGKTPNGTYITKDFLTCNYKDKEFSYKIERKDPYILYMELYELLNKKLGIISNKEKCKKRIDFNKIEYEIQATKNSWVDIKKKNIKDLLIELFVIDMKNQYFLTQKQTQYLLSVICIAMIFKVITNKDINYTNGKIQNIEGINFEHKKIILNLNIYNEEYNFYPEIIIDKIYMSDNWIKYLNKL